MNGLFEAIQASQSGNHGLPNGVYTEARFFKWEKSRFFARRWFGLAFAADVPSPGDLKRVDILGMSVILARDEQNNIRVYQNVCRHRGRRLMDKPCDHAKLIRCPYHAWTYRLDGALNGTPHIGGAGVHKDAEFDPENYSLYEIPSRVWMDIVFINPDGNAESFEDFIAPVAKRLSRLWGEDGAGHYQPAADGMMEMEVASNWKLALENYLEAYHLPIVHPGLNSYSPLGKHYQYYDAKNFAGQGVTAYNPNISIGVPMPVLTQWPQELHQTAEYPAIYPNVLFGLQRDHTFTMLLIPLDQEKTLERVELQFVGDSATDEAYLATRRAILEGWRTVFQEDVDAVEGMQAGRHCDAFDGGVFTPKLENTTRHFHRWFAAQVESTGA